MALGGGILIRRPRPSHFALLSPIQPGDKTLEANSFWLSQATRIKKRVRDNQARFGSSNDSNSDLVQNVPLTWIYIEKLIHFIELMCVLGFQSTVLYFLIS